MDRDNSGKVLAGVLVVLVIVLSVSYYLNHKRPAPPKAADYYTGPFRAAGRNIYSDINGNPVPAPAGSQNTASSAGTASGAAVGAGAGRGVTRGQ